MNKYINKLKKKRKNIGTLRQIHFGTERSKR